MVEVPDDWVAEKVEESWADADPDAPPKPTPQEYFLGRLEDVCGDELPIALWSWPATFSVEVDAAG